MDSLGELKQLGGIWAALKTPFPKPLDQGSWAYALKWVSPSEPKAFPRSELGYVLACAISRILIGFELQSLLFLVKMHERRIQFDSKCWTRFVALES